MRGIGLRMGRRTLAVLMAGTLAAQGDTDLERGFASPPEWTRPRCYWYWVNGQISKEGITRDLEAMKRVGIGEGYIGVIDGGELKALTDPWWGLLEHAVREGGRIGVDVGVFNCPGWSQSGGPWIKPEESMRFVATRELRLKGPRRYEGPLPAPEGALQDVAVLAFPAPAGDAETAAARAPKITTAPEAKNAARLADGDPATTCALTGAPQVTFEMTQPFAARSLTVHPAGQMNVTGELLASDDGVSFRPVKSFRVDRHNLSPNVGPVPLAPVAVAFPAVTARLFRVAFSGGGTFGELELSSAARLENHAEKQLAKVFQDPQPPFDFYTWPQPAEPEDASFAVDPAQVRDLRGALGADGTLRWDVPAGEWVVLRAAMKPTGTRNSPAPPEATGPEVDKMSRAALAKHFDAYVGELLRRVPAAERKALKHVVADSYEMGPQNWTDGFAETFRRRYGYDPRPFLPVLTGRLVGGADKSERFLWDLRRLVADRVASEYVGGLRDLCRKAGLRMWLENYGHWGFPGEFLLYGGSCDEISGEFWADGDLGSVELRDASSAAHIYGLPQVFAEAFTGGPLWRSTPWSLKKRGDWAFCQGINQFVLHVCITQPRDDRRPGMSAWYGTEFNRHNTWFELSRSWIDYLRRCHFLLQQGTYVADVAYFIGEDAPKMTGLRRPELPPGYDFDYINADVIRNRLRVKDGRLVLPDGMSYRVLVLPESETMRPELLARVRDLVRDGGAVLGAPPSRSPSLEGFPGCDAEVTKLAAELWGPCDGKTVTAAAFGRGRVFRGVGLPAVLGELRTPPDLAGVDPGEILFIHRRTPAADVYFVCNQGAQPARIVPSFRVDGRAPELWRPETGAIERPAVYDAGGGAVRVPLALDARGSVFVVFRGAAAADRIVDVQGAGETIWSTEAPPLPDVPGAGETPAPGTFTMALWAKPAVDTVLLPESNRGISGLQDARNDAVAPTHGGQFSSDGTHAGAGIAVGRNGVCVFEHGAGYFAPVLVHPAALTGWTHVAVVYRDGQPELFLNGAAARRGLKSEHPVHPGAPGGGTFRGGLAGSVTSGRALDAAALTRLIQAMPRPADAAGAAVELARAGQGLEATGWRAGEYTARAADGTTRAFAIPALPAPLEVAGPWEVRFPDGHGIAGPVRLDKLASWSEHATTAVRYFSGAAVYRKTMEIPADRLAPGRVLVLDLGEVESLAEVTLNGRHLGTLWKPPFRVDVSGAARAGANELEVRVANTWHNRLLGEIREPAAFGGPGAFKPWASIMPKYGAGEPLLPAGLIGPVTLRSGAKVVGAE